MNFQRMTDLDLAGKRVLIREDLDVPVKNGVITSDARLRAALPTIKAAIEKGAAVMVYSHLGRPVEGEPKPEQSLAPVQVAIKSGYCIIIIPLVSMPLYPTFLK